MTKDRVQANDYGRCFCSLHCLDTDGWVTERTYCLQKSRFTNPRISSLEQVEEEKQAVLLDLDSRGKQT